MPIAVLIGTIYALARLAQTSQYTILRTGGLGPGRALWLLASLALVFGAVTFVVGDYVAPFSERVASQLRAALQRRPRSSAAREPGSRSTRTTPDGERSYSINVGSAERGTLLRDVRIFEFDADGQLLSRTAAAEADGRSATAPGRCATSTVTRWREAGGESSARRGAAWRESSGRARSRRRSSPPPCCR